MKTTFSLYFALLAFGLLASAQNQTYPGCMSNSCGSLRNTAFSQCDYDFYGQVAATSDQTTCICSINDISTPLSECIACIRLNPDLTSLADSYESICTAYRATALPNTGNNSTASITSSSNTSSTTSTSSSRTTRAPTTTTAAVSSDSAASQTTATPSASDTGGAGSNVPVIALALVLLFAQAGL